MPSAQPRFTRGVGLLEPHLARWRARQANRLIPPALRAERILDIGCGSYPYFLAHTSFTEKFAIDQLPPAPGVRGIHWHTLDLNRDPHLPFADCFFSVVTMLAVAEHLDPANLLALFADTHRVLRPGGMVILTTPAAWSAGLLKLMALAGLVSLEEIREHRYSYTLPLIGWYFAKAGFATERTRHGYFEFGLNLWATAER